MVDKQPIQINSIPLSFSLEPGSLTFSRPSFLFKESSGKASIQVDRSNGADGVIGVKWHTVDGTAFAGKDYEKGQGTLYFKHGELTKMIDINIFDDQVKEQ